MNAPIARAVMSSCSLSPLRTTSPRREGAALLDVLHITTVARSIASKLFALVALVAASSACGGAPRGGDTTSASGAHRTGPITRGPDGLPVDGREMDERVESWRTAHRYVLRAADRCVSGSMDLYLPAVDARWARSIRFRMHAPRSISFHVELRAPGAAEGQYLSATMWGADAEEHARILREQTACISQTVASVAPAGSGAPATAVTSSAPPARGTTARRPRPRARDTARVTVVASAAPPAAIVSVPPVTAEAPVRGFVDLGNETYNPLGDTHYFDKEFVIQPRFAQIPMNNVNRGWVIDRPMNTPLVVRIWTQDPQDFEGVVLQIEDLVLEPHIPEAEYTRLMDRRVGAGNRRQEEFTALCRAHPDDRQCYFTEENRRRYVGATRPPPPPRDEEPPHRPSADHVWIAGGWQWNGSDYVWISGMWRFVPPAIIATAAGSTNTTTAPTAPLPEPPRANATAAAAPASSNTNVASSSNATSSAASNTNAASVSATATVSAPAPAVIMPTAAPVAPPPRAEAIPPAPQAGAMWIAGYWQWSGTAWAWTSGHWQMPPAVNVRWTPPAVQVGTGGVQVFMPGGWIRLGR